MRCFHTDPFVNSLRTRVIGLDIQTKSAHIPFLSCLLLYKIIKLAIDLLPSNLRPYIDALYPPKPRVTPIAPLVCDHQATDYLACRFGNDVKSFLFFAENGLHTAAQSDGIEMLSLGFERHRLIKFD